MNDEFKIEITQSIYILFNRIPSKSEDLIKFLFNTLVGEGSKSWKESIVETLMKIGLEGTLEDKEKVLHALCDFIEDCQFAHIATYILDFVSREAGNTSNPSLYIRYIFNRIILDQAEIRAAAVSALGTIGHKIAPLRAQVI